jgi:hypothetical protein
MAKHSIKRSNKKILDNKTPFSLRYSEYHDYDEEYLLFLKENHPEEYKWLEEFELINEYGKQWEQCDECKAKEERYRKRKGKKTGKRKYRCENCWENMHADQYDEDDMRAVFRKQKDRRDDIFVTCEYLEDTED